MTLFAAAMSENVDPSRAGLQASQFLCGHRVRMAKSPIDGKRSARHAKDRAADPLRWLLMSYGSGPPPTAEGQGSGSGSGRNRFRAS